ncbi:MAG: hypothetical protein ACXVJD_14175 [Mucilaginibacter sp.]
MFKARAFIKLYKSETSRKTAFHNNYRPLFEFSVGMKKSGQITLSDRTEIFPGDNGIVDISFLDDAFLGSDFGLGTKFTFGEGGVPLGEGEIISIIK